MTPPPTCAYPRAMREKGLSWLPSVLALAFTALLVAPVATLAASGLPATITMLPEEAGPGASVEITGLDFQPNQTVDLQLTTTAGPVELGTATTVEGGYFRQAVTLPADAPIGYWEVRATDADGSVAVHLFESVEAAAPAAAETVSSEAEAAGGNSAGDLIVMLVFALLIAGVGGGVAYVVYQNRVGSRQPGMSAGADPIWSSSAALADPEATATEEPTWIAAQPNAQLGETPGIHQPR